MSHIAYEEDAYDDPLDPLEPLVALLVASWLCKETLPVGVLVQGDELFQLPSCLIVVDRDEPNDREAAQIVQGVHRTHRNCSPSLLMIEALLAVNVDN